MSFDAAKWNRFEAKLKNLEEANKKGSSDYFVAIQGKGPAGELIEIKCLSSNWLKRQFQRVAIWFKAPQGTELVYARARSDNLANKLILSKLSEQIRTELRFCTLDEPQLLERMRERQITSLSNLINPQVVEEESFLASLPLLENHPSSGLSSPRSVVSDNSLGMELEESTSLETGGPATSEPSNNPINQPRALLEESSFRFTISGENEITKVHQIVQEAHERKELEQEALKNAQLLLQSIKKSWNATSRQGKAKSDQAQEHLVKLKEAEDNLQLAQERLALAELFLEESTRCYKELQLVFHANEILDRVVKDESHLNGELRAARSELEHALEKERKAQLRMQKGKGAEGSYTHQESYEKALLERERLEKKIHIKELKLKEQLELLNHEHGERKKQVFFSQKAFYLTLKSAQQLKELLDLPLRDNRFFEKDKLAQRAMETSEQARGFAKHHRKDMQLHKDVQASSDEAAALMKSVCHRVNLLLNSVLGTT